MKNKWILIILGVLVVAGLILILKSNENDTPGSTTYKLKIATSFYPLYFFSTQIGGDKADVRNITPSGSEPHDYEPTTQDMARIETSNLLVLNGGVEAWADKVRENLKGKNVKIVIAGEELLTKELKENGETVKDPHVWLDPQLAKKEAQKITEGYIAIDPSNSTYYQNNEQELESKLGKLDQNYKQGLQNCQSENIITSHAAFGYLATRYGLNQVTVTGVSPDAEPSAQQLANVADFAKKNNVKYIFFESLVSPKLSETIAKEIGAKTLVLDPIEGISEDDIKQGKNYFTVMENNLKNLRIALECK